MKKLTSEDALVRAEKLCATQERCTSDIIARLGKWGIPDRDHEKIIRKLVQNKFLDDARYAVLFTRDKQKFNKWGKEKIRFELRKKGLDNQVIESALSELSEDSSLNILRELMEKKKKEIKYSSLFEMKGKLVRYGIQKGYSYDEVYRLVDEIIQE